MRHNGVAVARLASKSQRGKSGRRQTTMCLSQLYKKQATKLTTHNYNLVRVINMAIILDENT